MKTKVVITAVWLRRIGDRAEVLVEIPGRGWCLAITEHAEASYSHIAEGNGSRHWPTDYLDNPSHPPSATRRHLWPVANQLKATVV